MVGIDGATSTTENISTNCWESTGEAERPSTYRGTRLVGREGSWKSDQKVNRKGRGGRRWLEGLAIQKIPTESGEDAVQCATKGSDTTT